MRLLSSSYPLTPLVLLLSLFQISILATPHIFQSKNIQLAPRQAITSCSDYSMIANYSTISNNSTLRAAFLQASPQGTDRTTAILNGAAKKLQSVMFDKALNAKCGNLTTLAAEEAPKNFSLGIVGPFTIKAIANTGVRVGSGFGLGTVVLVAVMVAAGSWL